MIDQLLVLNGFFRNKLDESENVIRNKGRLVAQGYTQNEGINFEETFIPVIRLEARLLLLHSNILSFFKWMLKVHF